MIVLCPSPNPSPDDPAIIEAAKVLRAGGLVAMPTETVYGLAARADDGAAVRRIFAAKGRPSTNPLIVHVASEEAARAVAASWPPVAHALSVFWPGPLTLVVEAARGKVATEVTAGGDTVALRVPDHPIARALIRAAGVPVAAPSANRSTSISPTTAEHVQKSLGERVDVILDGGATGFGIESSIVDVTCAPAALLRHGAIPLALLARHAAILDKTSVHAPEGERARAPGMLKKHYAPAAIVEIAEPGEVAQRVIAARASGERAASLERAPGSSISAPSAVLPPDPEGYAKGLYAALHALEDAGAERIVVAEVPEGDAWAAVRDRLSRASA